ncbi:MAG: NAD(P)H-binding protein [Saprospiraceae bacterium]
MKTAIILGATGLTGSQLLDLLLQDTRFSTVKILVRRTVGFTHPKLKEHIVDFDQPKYWSSIVTGDVLFSTLGTTLKKAGSQEAQYEVDYNYQYQVAEIAARNGVPTYVLVSASGANENSPFFYLRTKGELDQAVQRLRFRRINIMRPGFLDGDRKESRAMEKLGLKTIKALNNWGLLHNFRPIHVRQLARIMIEIAFEETIGVKIYEAAELLAFPEHSA